MNIISARRRIDARPYYRRVFDWRDMPGAGFSFDVVNQDDPQTAVCDPQANDAATANLRACLDGTNDVTDRGNVQYWAPAYSVPAVGQCDRCRRHVTLDGFTNTCDCGADYNASGQRLAPREQWGEETGESVGDILRIA